MRHKVLDLRPTQMATGMKEIDARVKKMRGMKPKELEDYLDGRPVPVVLGPRARTFLVDHHHLARACWEAGIEELKIEIKADLSKLSFPELWKEMEKRHWIYTYDQFGNGPHDPVDLPETVKCLADDPYRSLAWAVREQGGYQKCEVPFSEFKWAAFFRKELKGHPVFDHFDETVREALELAKSAAAKNLPGYVGGKN